MRKTFIILSTVFVIAAIAIAAITLSTEQNESEVNSYQECVDKGYPVFESYPEQCKTPDGKTFTRKLDKDELPVKQQRTVQIFHYNQHQDKDENGTILCSEQGLVPVDRKIPVSQTPIQDTIDLLLSGDIRPQEKERDLTTEYPLEGLELNGAALNDGVLTLEFEDPNNATSGGSCRSGILWLQIKNTALQFEAVDEVQFKPEHLFQP